jgi:hypothetical protein
MPLGVQYHRRHVQEEILEQLPFGVIICNRLGCEILNTERVMFMDWDIDVKAHLKTQARGWFTRIRHLLAGPSRSELEAARRECKQIRYRLLRDQFKDLRMLSARLYETHNGFRAIITSSLFDPAEKVAQARICLQSILCPPVQNSRHLSGAVNPEVLAFGLTVPIPRAAPVRVHTAGASGMA